jgi:plastocyanin
MEREARRRRDRARTAGLILLAAGAALLSSPSGAAAEEHEYRFRIPITVGGYQVLQNIRGNAPRPMVDGHITKMSTDVVDAGCADVQACPDSEPVPISRLMLHHIVFLNQGRKDQTCGFEEGILGFDNLQRAPGIERFFAAGEERARLAMPPGYGYDMGAPPQPTDPPLESNRWHVLYMVMNHKAETDSAFIEYEVTVEDGEGLEDPVQSAVPFWMDVENCSADPIYNVPGTGTPDEENVNVRDFPVDQAKLGAAGGRIVAGAGHVHGGAYRLEVSQPACDDRSLATSEPTWGNPDHDFYNVKPILHEPGPINMTAFESEQGFPVRAGQPLRLRSVYDDTRPHTRVMGIMIVFIAPDNSVPAATEELCSPGALPTDVVTRGSDTPGRTGEPPVFKVPLTGIDRNGNAVTIAKPPGRTHDLESGARIRVESNEFSRRNVRIGRGDELNWIFDTESEDVHNVTLANGPKAIGSPNLSRDSAGIPREFTRRFNKAGTYRLFCALHPTQMTERVVVEP